MTLLQKCINVRRPLSSTINQRNQTGKYASIHFINDKGAFIIYWERVKLGGE